ncbi:MAG: tail fiber protein, partial [Bacteroidota bacterium]
PRNWAFCEGQLLPLAQNTALFSLIGTTYGGDGRTTTGLPNLKGRAPLHPGRGPGLSSYKLGQRGGAATHTLTFNELPRHSHNLQLAAGGFGDLDMASPNELLATRTNELAVYSAGTPNVQFSNTVIGNAGGGQAHNNMQPYLGMYYVIALQGVYPSRS